MSAKEISGAKLLLPTNLESVLPVSPLEEADATLFPRRDFAFVLPDVKPLPAGTKVDSETIRKNITHNVYYYELPAELGSSPKVIEGVDAFRIRLWGAAGGGPHARPKENFKTGLSGGFGGYTESIIRLPTSNSNSE